LQVGILQVGILQVGILQVGILQLGQSGKAKTAFIWVNAVF